MHCFICIIRTALTLHHASCCVCVCVCVFVCVCVTWHWWRHSLTHFHMCLTVCLSSDQCTIMCYDTPCTLHTHRALHSEAYIWWQHGRVVKAIDSKSIGLCPRRFKSCCCRMVMTYIHAWMAERSKAVDLSSIIFGCVGSNPTSGICVLICLYYDMPM